MRNLILALLFAAFGAMALPAEAVKHCACRPRLVVTEMAAEAAAEVAP